MKVLSAVINNIESDQRLDKVCNSLLKFGFDVELIGTNLRGNPKLNKKFKTYIFPLKNQKSSKLYIEFNLKLFFILLKKVDKNTILLANDLDSLLPFYLVSKLKNRPLIYDSHEIFSELPSLTNRPKTKKFWKTLEKFIVPRLKHFYTVSDGYSEWFHKEYGIKPIVIKNVPKLQTLHNTQDIFFKLPEKSPEEKIVIYQGVLNISRGIEKTIEAMQYVDNCQFWILGNGPKREELIALTQKLNLEKRVHFLGNVKPIILRTITPLADVGISLEEDLGISYRYALPNKLFDLIQAKVPILGTNLPEIKKVITDNKIGKVINNHDPKHIAEKIKELILEGKLPYLTNLTRASKEYCWENEEQKLKKIYKPFLDKKI